ncbi:MAG: STAS domain-containing protein [Bacteroidaceae bacterium]|nr:STAS domain-containing protein [Bacteroidaceae bacterium]
MKLKITPTPDVINVVLNGSLNTQAAQEIEPQITELETQASKPIIIDCTDLQYIASSGLRLLLRLRKAAFTHGQTITLSGVNENVLEVLHITNFDKMFKIV